MVAEVKVLSDSVGGGGSREHRLITIKTKYPRIIHSEVLTSRSFSRNSESSRAVPTAKKLKAEIYCPTIFRKKVKGMGSGNKLSNTKNLIAQLIWKGMSYVCKGGCYLLSKLGVAKQWANRPLEWFSTIEVIITADYGSWQHFLSLRDHKDCQPEMQELAKAVRSAIEQSVPNILSYGSYHIPYDVGKYYTIEDRKNIAVGLIAGVSYVKEMEISKALELGRKLKEHVPPHLSPYESVAQCMQYGDKYYNLNGWRSMRYELEEKEKQK